MIGNPQKYLIDEIRITGAPAARTWAIEGEVARFSADFRWKVKRDGLLVAASFEITFNKPVEWFVGALTRRIWDAARCYCGVSLTVREILEGGAKSESAVHARDESDYHIYTAACAHLRRERSFLPTHAAVIIAGDLIFGAWPAFSEEEALSTLRVWYAGRRAVDYLNNRSFYESEAASGPDPITATLAEISAWYCEGEGGYYVDIIELNAEGPLEQELKEHAGVAEYERAVRVAVSRVLESHKRPPAE